MYNICVFDYKKRLVIVNGVKVFILQNLLGFLGVVLDVNIYLIIYVVKIFGDLIFVLRLRLRYY